MGEWLKGKVAVITGAGGGIGRAVALDMASQGAKIVVNDLGGASDGTGASQTAAQKVVSEIKAKGSEGVANYDSVASMQGAENIIKTAVDAFGKVDILATCAGILRDRMLFNMTEAEWDAVLNVHLKGTFACIKFASQRMREQKHGRIITFTSSTGIFGNPGQVNYAAAKSAIAGLTKVAALDLGRYGITVNSIAPLAATRLTMNETVLKQLATRAEKDVKDQSGGFDSNIAEMSPEDVAPMVTYLASDLGAGVNGQIIFAAGGSIGQVAPVRAAKTIYKPGKWTLEELMDTLPKTLLVGITNPAPVEKK